MADGNWFDVIYKLNSIFSTRFAAVCARGYHFMYGVSYIYNMYIYTHNFGPAHPIVSGAFIQKHSSVITLFLSLAHSFTRPFFSFFHFFSRMDTPALQTMPPLQSRPWSQCAQFSFLLVKLCGHSDNQHYSFRA